MWYGYTIESEEQKMAQSNKFIPSKATPEQLRARLELRRSNASVPHRNKKAYNRKQKHKGYDL